ncbi:type I-B CRISPR-associated protein Cas5 [bacterium]|nr:type I-B CRISPR-associated protein Cas5 [bacterium]
MKVLIFDVWGDYAHFRKIYTTTSPLTYSIPTRTSLCGLIGAIIGLSKENNSYLNYFHLNQAKIGLRIVNYVKKVHIAENLIHTKDAKGIGMNLITTRAQIRFEFLKDPKYRIYFWHNDNKFYNRLKKNLVEHKSVYTPCLGLSENIANFGYIGEVKAVEKSTKDDFIQIHSVVTMEKISEKNGINFEVQEREYFSENLPIEMNQERIVTKYGKILIERNGNPLEVKMQESYFEINYNNGKKENIVFIE